MAWPLKCIGGFDKLVQSEVEVEVAFARLPPPDESTHIATVEPLVTGLDVDRIAACLEHSSEWKDLVAATQCFMQAVKPIAEVSVNVAA